MRIVGFLFLFVYILVVGLGSFFQKFALKQLTPYQLEFLIGIGMLIISVPVLLWQQKSLYVPIKDVPWGMLIALLFATGSFVYVLAVSRLPVGIAASVSTGYVAVALILSVIFLHEDITIMKVIGVALTVVGVAILSQQ